MLDISTRAAAETFSFELTDADDSPLRDEHGNPCLAVVYGPGSAPYVAAQARKQARLLQRMQRGKAIALSAEEAARQAAEFLADITVSLDLAYGGLEGRAKLLAIYSDPAVGFIAEQVAGKAADWGNFSRGSAKS